MNSRTMTALILIGVLLLGVLSSLYVVTARERAVVLRFGEIIKPDVRPGLHFKIPFIDKLRLFDGRIQTLDVPQERFFTQEKKAVIVDAFIKWRISDVQQFYKATSGDGFRANTLLSQQAGSRLREKFGVLTLNEVVSGQRDELMIEITQILNKSMEQLGMQVVDVRVKKIDLPPQVSDSVFDRMSSERRKEAQEYRSKGNEMAKAIRANADRERQVIIAAAYRDSEKIRGEGDAKAATIYAKAFGKNVEFYSFHRSLKAYRDTFSSGSDVLLLEPDSEFFKFMKNASGK